MLTTSEIEARIRSWMRNHQLEDTVIIPDMADLPGSLLTQHLQEFGGRLATVETQLGKVGTVKMLMEDEHQYNMSLATLTASQQYTKVPAKERLEAQVYQANETLSTQHSELMFLKALVHRLEHLRAALVTAYNTISRTITMQTAEMERLRGPYR